MNDCANPDLNEHALTASLGVIPYQDVKMCNCANCNVELLGESMPTNRDRLPPEVADLAHVYSRFQDRPYCRGCWDRIKIA